MTDLIDLSPAEQLRSIAVVGGGIAGLYTAWKLAVAHPTRKIVLIEASDRWGGKIETEVLGGFNAEFGPMRFELGVQPLFKQLTTDLGIDFIEFPPPTSPNFNFPSYSLLDREKNKSALILLKHGIIRVMGKDPNDPNIDKWLESLTEDGDYAKFRKEAQINGQLLRNIGIWQALSSADPNDKEHGIVLSHQAIMKIRDTGTFYHLLPQNVNAIEWIIWWLRVFKPSGSKMSTLKNGSKDLVEKLLLRLRGAEFRNRVIMVNKVKIDAFSVDSENPSLVTLFSDGRPLANFSHLVLALPKASLLNYQSILAHTNKPILKDLDSVVGYSLLKVFFVTTKPWWNENLAQDRANTMPTREVHYFRRPASNLGMAMIYTDDPASEYWKHYVLKETHDKAELNNNDHLKAQFSRWLAKDAFDALHQKSDTGLMLTTEATQLFSGMSLGEIEDYILNSVTEYGIRDWGRAPYHGAFHAWRVGAKSWEVIENLSSFRLRGSRVDNIHICGEAYSNYQGFIEGALRTSHKAMSKIPRVD